MRLPVILAAAIAFAGGVQATGTADAVPVLVELFTSEGCSSCPAADVLLEKMLAQQPAAGAVLVGLGEHVDYWNDAGWRDRFSSARFTERQQEYAARSGRDEVYTPQMVIDGREAFVGTDIGAARRAIEHAIAMPHARIHVAVDAGRSDTNMIAVTIDIGNLSSASNNEDADVLVAVTEDGLRTDVKRGENQGRRLAHAAVVRDLVIVGAAAADKPVRGTIRLQPGWHREALKIVAFVQQRRSRRVLATAAAPLESVR